MNKAIIRETDLRFSNLARRTSTKRIVIHHSGTVQDLDLSAAQIHQAHKAKGWAGIGYHFVIRKNGAIERGRPLWSLGAHAQSNNHDTIGIHLSGDFNSATPTDYQIESLALLIANLSADFNIPIDRAHVIGHDECYSKFTDGAGCPGRNLYKLLDTIAGKAAWYLKN